jgi:hypothetical protein
MAPLATTASRYVRINGTADAVKVVGPLKRSWKSFLEEHDQLRREAERLPAVADMVGEISVVTLKSNVDDIYGFLSHRLLPHISVEEGVLYPAIARAEGLREAGEMMHRDHVEIASFVRELASVRDALVNSWLAKTPTGSAGCYTESTLLSGFTWGRRSRSAYQRSSRPRPRPRTP